MPNLVFLDALSAGLSEADSANHVNQMGQTAATCGQCARYKRQRVSVGSNRSMKVLNIISLLVLCALPCEASQENSSLDDIDMLQDLSLRKNSNGSSSEENSIDTDNQLDPNNNRKIEENNEYQGKTENRLTSCSSKSLEHDLETLKFYAEKLQMEMDTLKELANTGFFTVSFLYDRYGRASMRVERARNKNIKSPFEFFEREPKTLNEGSGTSEKNNEKISVNENISTNVNISVNESQGNTGNRLTDCNSKSSLDPKCPVFKFFAKELEVETEILEKLIGNEKLDVVFNYAKNGHSDSACTSMTVEPVRNFK